MSHWSTSTSLLAPANTSSHHHLQLLHLLLLALRLLLSTGMLGGKVRGGRHLRRVSDRLLSACSSRQHRLVQV